LTAERVERRLAAVLAADVAGYSLLMGTDELGTLEALKAHRREIVDPAIASYKGRIVKTTGDGMLVEFASAVDAVTCAIAVQEKIPNATAASRRRSPSALASISATSSSTATTFSAMASMSPPASRTSASRAPSASLAVPTTRSAARPRLPSTTWASGR
jgi:hypothetical protein